MTQEHSLERAGADLRAATSAMPFPEKRARHGFRAGLFAFAAGLAVALIIGIPAFLAQVAGPGGGAPVGAPDSTTTTETPQTTSTSAPVTTTSAGIDRPPTCGVELPWDVELPADFTGPHQGASPHSSTSVDEGQTIVHWLGRDGSVEIRWPADGEYLDGVHWGEPVDGAGRVFAELALFLFSDPDLETVGASQVLPSEIMDGPCDAAQLSVYATEGDSAVRSPNPALFGQSETADVVVYPNLARPRDKVLVVETLEIGDLPEVVECGGGPGVEDVPPNKTGTTPDSPVFETAEEALEHLLATDVANPWPKKGYFELVLADGTVVYGNPYDDMSPDPRPDNGLVVAITVMEAEDGWTVSGWETSGC